MTVAAFRKCLVSRNVANSRKTRIYAQAEQVQRTCPSSALFKVLSCPDGQLNFLAWEHFDRGDWWEDNLSFDKSRTDLQCVGSSPTGKPSLATHSASCYKRDSSVIAFSIGIQLQAIRNWQSAISRTNWTKTRESFIEFLIRVDSRNLVLAFLNYLPVVDCKLLQLNADCWLLSGFPCRLPFPKRFRNETRFLAKLGISSAGFPFVKSAQSCRRTA